MHTVQGYNNTYSAYFFQELSDIICSISRTNYLLYFTIHVTDCLINVMDPGNHKSFFYNTHAVHIYMHARNTLLFEFFIL